MKSCGGCGGGRESWGVMEEVDAASGGPSSLAILHELGLEVMGPGWLLPARFCSSGEKHSCPFCIQAEP